MFLRHVASGAALASAAAVAGCGGNGASPFVPSTAITGTFSRYVIPGGGLIGPDGITAGSDGAVWFTEFDANKIGRITTSGSITQFAIPTIASSSESIAAGTDGALWFTERDGNKIGRITTGGAFSEFPLPAAASAPTGITAGVDGAMWFIQNGAQRIGRISMHGTFRSFAVPGSSHGLAAVAVTAGPDGAMWFTESTGLIAGPAGAIGRMTPGGVTAEYPLPAGHWSPGSIAAGSDGALWFSNSGLDSEAGRITTTGAVTFWPSPMVISGAVTHGPDGAIWGLAADHGAHSVVRIAPSGAASSIFIPAPGPGVFAAPSDITTGPDGALWITDANGLIWRLR